MQEKFGEIHAADHGAFWPWRIDEGDEQNRLALACVPFATGPFGVNSPLSIHSVGTGKNVSRARTPASLVCAGDSAELS